MIKSVRLALISLSVCLVLSSLWSSPLPPQVGVHVGPEDRSFDDVDHGRDLPDHRRQEGDSSDEDGDRKPVDADEPSKTTPRPRPAQQLKRGTDTTYEPLDADEGSDEGTSPTLRKLQSSKSFANGAANRSPHRSRTPLLSPEEAGDGKVVPLDAKKDIECWGIGGEGGPVHGWSIPLLSRIDKHWDTFVEATRDPWTALVVWSPVRFMPPQAPGRKANGDVQEAPTRGKDPKYYLKTYNATWHASFDAAGLSYVAQLSHRNALAVCVRERLHINLVRCSTKGRAPIPVYYCPCRHCPDNVLRKTTKPRKELSLTAPVLKWTPKADIYASAAQASGTKPCVEAASAPWLVPRAHVARFPYEGKHSDLDALLKVQADENKIVVVSILNVFWIDHLHNEVFSGVANAGIRNYIIATMDSAALALCRRNRLPCYDAEHLAEFEDDLQEGRLDHKKGRTRKVTEGMSWIKPRLALAVLERGYGFVMCDLDMSWVKNPMKDVLGAGVDIAHQCDNKNKFSINSGYYFARPNPRTLRYFNNLMLFVPEETPDQTAMKLMARYDHTHGATHACLDQWAFNMKCNYKQEKTKRGKGEAMTYEWLPFERDRKKFFFRMLHATCLSGALNKMRYLRTVNAWYLDDLDKLTQGGGKQGGKGYCLRLPDGSEVVGSRGTIHSEGYTYDDDPAYLKKRH